MPSRRYIFTASTCCDLTCFYCYAQCNQLCVRVTSPFANAGDQQPQTRPITVTMTAYQRDAVQVPHFWQRCLERVLRMDRVRSGAS